jgi:hypothetical protein
MPGNVRFSPKWHKHDPEVGVFYERPGIVTIGPRRFLMRPPEFPDEIEFKKRQGHRQGVRLLAAWFRIPIVCHCECASRFKYG